MSDNMTESQKKAFDFYADWTKQLITLSTAIIALMVTFSKDIIGGTGGKYVYLLLVTWIFYFVSIICGILTLQALNGNLDPRPQRETGADGNITETPVPPNLTVNSDNVRSTSLLQIGTFVFALALTCIYGFFTASLPAHQPAQTPAVNAPAQSNSK